MNDRPEPHEESDADLDSRTMAPLPGESGIPNVAERSRSPMSKKGLLAVGLLILSLIAVSAFSIQRFASSGKKVDVGDARRASDRPAAATAEPHRLDMTAAAASSPRIPALVPNGKEVAEVKAEEEAEPIGVRRTGPGAPVEAAARGGKTVLPEDAPVLLVTTRPGVGRADSVTLHESAGQEQSRQEQPQDTDPNDPIAATTRNLQGYQQHLQGLLDKLTQSTAAATGPSSLDGTTPGLPLSGPLTGNASSPSPRAGLFGGQLQGSTTPRAVASTLGDRSLILPKGTTFTCALKTKVINATSGFVGCQVQRNVFSDDGRVLLVERGSHLDGEYHITSVRPGTVRIPILWTRLRTPNGVTVDLDSPGTGPLGESGIDGHVDNRWPERIGAAMLLSLIDDSVKMVLQGQAGDAPGSTVVLPSTTSNTSKLAEKVLDSTINIPPLIYQNQGGIVGIYVARDVDFSSVYELQPVARGEP